ncbi:MAG TPA: HDIG domain-containing protein [Chitinophagales bacterium]|nr:HDIG domain-containing protein [Chitinophagales bacterium]
MNRVFVTIVNRHQDILRYIIILGSTLVISFFFPKSGIFKYDFEIGKPWKYDNLIAPLDIGILKTEQQIMEEKEWLLEGFSPYYRLDLNVAESQKKKFIEAFHQKLPEVRQQSADIDSLENLQLGLSILDTIFSTGIISLIDEHKSFPPSKEIAVLTQDNTADKKPLSELFSIKRAFDFAKDSLKAASRDALGFMLPLIERALAYNVFYDDATTKKFQDELFDNISLTRGIVQQGELIIAKGAIVTPEKYQMLVSFREEYEGNVFGMKKAQIIYFGNFLLTLIVLTILAVLLKVFSREVWESNRKHLLVYFLITVMIVLISTLVDTDLPILYAIPVCIVPIVLRTFFGTTLALHAHIALVLLSSFIVPDGIQFAFLQFIAGMVAILSNVRSYYWSQFFLSNGFILLTYLLGYFALAVMQEGTFHDINFANFGWLGLNVLLTLLAYPLVPLLEKGFGFVSDITLLELSDINKPLLKELSIKAPGTFQHSLQVSYLAEAAASEIGANTLLVKAGALYHDIGKMNNPLYFIENQHPDINPHDELTFEESAKIIIGHVKEGVHMAKKYKLPDVIIDFIRTHHGTTVVQYFYHSFLKNFPQEEADIEDFRYPGPLPYSKETAIVMMADSSEAASRSLRNPSSSEMENLVENIINSKIKENQLVNSNITFKEITLIKKVFKKMLNSIHHARIAYPESNE